MARIERNDVRVLVVEDNEDAAESVRCLLSQCGYQVMVAHTGQEGVTTARKLQPHVVLCDIGLPDADGYSVASVLRQGDNGNARIIAVTGHGSTMDRRRALAAGFDEHLVKPVDPRVLLDAIHMFG
jgi:DNA-binding response OmpR family regulator